MGKDELIDRVAVVVLAGGQGTRLFPLTQSRAKPAVGFGGGYRLIDIPLSNALNAKISHIYVISQYFASHLQQHIYATYQWDAMQKRGIHLLSPEEDFQRQVWFEGTADAIRKNLAHLVKAPVDYFLILSGDQLYNMDLGQLIRFAHEKKAEMVVAALCVEESEARRMGLMRIDEEGQIQDFKEKPQEKAVLNQFCLNSRYLASMGIYVFHRDALIKLLEHSGNDFGHHLIPVQVLRGQSYAYIYDGYWVDIGTISSFYEANMSLLDRKHCLQTYNEASPVYTRWHHLPSPLIVDSQIERSYISQGSIIEAKEVIHSILGLRCVVKKGTKIKDTVVMGHQFYAPPVHQHPPLPSQFTIGENCEIEKAIIDEHTCIGNHVQLVNKKQLKHYDSDGVYIRDGIIIVTTGTTLPDGFVL
jgi:glucose-1-phosphate adenylyltransferase